MTSHTSFRDHLYPNGHPRIEELKGLDASGYADVARADDFTGGLIRGWTPLYLQPFTGVTNDGVVRPGLYGRGTAEPGEEAPTAAMVLAAGNLLEHLSEDDRRRLTYGADAVEWQTWANPEFLQHTTGLRLEDQDEQTRHLVRELMRASLSADGFDLACTLMRINGFLGDVVGLPALMNEFSYNVALYGEPSELEPWGWQLFGHHLAINCLVVGTQLVMTPVFFGAEPTVIDDGPHAGARVFEQRIGLARRLMQSLTAPQQQGAQLYPSMVDPDMPEGRLHPGDERHLAGAFQDNRVIPYEGVRVGDLLHEARALVDALVEDFTAYLPAGPAAARRRDIADHYDDTWFSWIGGFADGDVFYFRLQSPVVIIELDHHCGVFLTNDHPQPFHIHTLMRTPNGNDYGRALLRADARSAS